MKTKQKKQDTKRGRQNVWIRQDHHAAICSMKRENGASIEFNLDKVIASGLARRRIPVDNPSVAPIQMDSTIQ